MKVLFQIGSLSRNAGGPFFSVRALAKHLHEIGDVEPAVDGFADEFFEEDKGQWGELALHPYQRPMNNPLGYSGELAEILRVVQPDIIDTQALWLFHSKAALDYSKRDQTPLVVTPRGMLDPWAIRNSEWKKKLTGWWYEHAHLNRAKCFHALNRSEYESIRGFGLRRPVCIIPNGIEITDALPERRESHSFKRLLFLGRLHPKKGVTELVAGWSKWKQRTTHANWRLLLGGWDDGGHESSLRHQVGELGDDSIEFIGPQFGDEKEKVLRLVDAFILPSFSEGLPMAVLEAWSYGLPVLMTDHCNLPEGFSGEAALRIEPNTESIARGLDELSSMNESDRWAMGMNGRRLVEKSFTWPEIARQMKEVYEWVLGGSPKPDTVVDG